MQSSTKKTVFIVLPKAMGKRAFTKFFKGGACGKPKADFNRKNGNLRG